MRSFGPLSALLLVSTVGCASASFATSSVGDTGPTETGSDPGDVGTGDTTPSCATPGPGDELWVDSLSTSPGASGTRDCPFRTITEALTAAGPSGARTIRVRGGAANAPRTYREPGLVRVRGGLTLLADEGPSTVRISANGTCTVGTAAFACVMQLEGGALLDGILVDAAGAGDAIVALGKDRPVGVKNGGVTGATGAEKAGLRLFGRAELGPGFTATGNADGVHVYDGVQVSVLAGGAVNVFSNNTGTGLAMESGTLAMNNSVARDNAMYGVRLTAGAHTIDGLEARTNVGGAGVFVDASASLSLRNSTLLDNRIGVQARSGASNVIDLGTSSAPGKNVFGGASGRNVIAGVCVASSDGTRTTLEGDFWTKCFDVRPSTTAGCSWAAGSAVDYADVYYGGATAPPTPMACDRGP